jgi:hypothetical protein
MRRSIRIWLIALWAFTFASSSFNPAAASPQTAPDIRFILQTQAGLAAAGGVSLVYTGTTPLPATGGFGRDLPLAYPAMLGEPLSIYLSYLPALRR